MILNSYERMERYKLGLSCALRVCRNNESGLDFNALLEERSDAVVHVYEIMSSGNVGTGYHIVELHGGVYVGWQGQWVFESNRVLDVITEILWADKEDMDCSVT